MSTTEKTSHDHIKSVQVVGFNKRRKEKKTAMDPLDPTKKLPHSCTRNLNIFTEKFVNSSLSNKGKNLNNIAPMPMFSLNSDMIAQLLTTDNSNLPTAFLSVSTNKRLDILSIKAIPRGPEILDKNTKLYLKCNKIVRIFIINMFIYVNYIV
ncbi:hypothetical protein GCM10023339_57680 [Alloalcanivorax gelatiniphagus]